jgi:hypothetical protein
MKNKEHSKGGQYERALAGGQRLEAAASAHANYASSHERFALCEQPLRPRCHPSPIARRSDAPAAALCGCAARTPRGAPPERALAGGQKLEAAASAHANYASSHERFALWPAGRGWRPPRPPTPTTHRHTTDLRSVSNRSDPFAYFVYFRKLVLWVSCHI